MKSKSTYISKEDIPNNQKWTDMNIFMRSGTMCSR